MPNPLPLPPPEILQQVSEEFAKIGIPIALAPQVCSRFLLAQGSIPNHTVLVLGAAAFIEEAPAGSQFPAQVFGAFAIPKNLAEDLIVRLRLALEISDDEMVAAMARNQPPR